MILEISILSFMVRVSVARLPLQAGVQRLK
jgi:hypothetical protein